MEDELPYAVWYQCRMCTHIFVDDIEKMFAHLEKRHGGMIDCEELREVVARNTLSCGGLPVPIPKPGNRKQEVEVEEEEEVDGGGDDDGDGQAPPHFLPRPRYIENANAFGENEMVLVAADDGEGDGGNMNGDYDEDAYNGEEGEGEEGAYRYQYSYDDEEQLPEDDPDLKLNGYSYENQEGDGYQVGGDGEEEEQEEEEGFYYDHREEGEIVGEGSEGNHSFNEEDYMMDEEEAQVYAEVVEEEEEEEEQLQLQANINGNGNGVKIIQVHNNSNGNGNRTTNGQNLLNGFGHSCKYCGKFFTTRRGVETHEQHHKSQQQNQNQNQASTSSSTSTGSPPRRQNERRLYPCKLCERRNFQTFKELKAHVKTHTDERIHICRFCCLTFNNTASLTKHLTIHMRENPNKCFCGKTFVSANTLKIHKKIHTGIKPFVCHFKDCGRAFVTKSTLESHLRTHTGEKPYQCAYCPSSFTTSSAKYRHERHVHKVPEPGQEDAKGTLGF